ncbi:MAG: DUF547 domain-containing protein [Saprospiraceae bacterium]|nr:DUF547 domain-containing protein [Saprospiraceae bacterium]
MRIFCHTFLFLVLNLNLIGQQNAFNTKFKSFISAYVIGNNIDYKAIDKSDIDLLNEALKNVPIKDLRTFSDIPFLINAYNFLSISNVFEAYPITSVKDIPDFFTIEQMIGNVEISLNKLEELIIEKMDSPAAHLLLSCSAKSCPPIYFIESNEDILAKVSDALSSPTILELDQENQRVNLSRIFYWYADSFDGEEGVREFIRTYLPDSDLSKFKVDYKLYNWSLNDINANEYLIYYPTKLYKKGGAEVKIFNNYYTQSDDGLRSNFFSSFFQVLIGTNKNINWGFDVKLRSVNQGNVGLFSALNLKNEKFHFSDEVLTFSRAGISGIGPRIKYQPFKNKGHINFLHSIYFVPVDNAEGNSEFGYFDFENLQIFNNVFIEKELSVKKRLFFDIGFHIENIRLGVQRNFNHTMQIQLPVTAIYSYFPNPKTTFYALANVAAKPIFTYAPNKDTNIKIDGYAQLGLGAKYYVTEFLELEILYTYFADQTPGRFANTFNIGLRFFKF